MSHKCGANCRRRQVPSGRPGCPSCGSPRRLMAGGKTRAVTDHVINNRHLRVTRRMIANVLDNWVIRGIHTTPDGEPSWNYYALVPGRNSMLRVAVSLDDERIVAAFPDEGATKAWKRGDLEYFRRRLAEVEERNGPESAI